MSGIAAIYRRDGQAVAGSSLDAMTGRLAHRGPDGIHHWSDGNVALGHCELKTLPEDDAEVQPLTGGGGLLHITFDGRIDNQAELLAQLQLPAGVRDARIALAAYEKWGEQCPERLLGDFAFVIWDSRTRSLFCARDVLGIRPFLYFASPDLFLAASERAALFAHPEVTYAPNEPVIAGLLYVTNISQSETIHRDVLRLPAASCMTVTATDIRIRRYWRIQDAPPVRLRSADEYAEALWSVLKDAVECRTRARGGVGVLLSGGLDSTAVASAACHLREHGRLASRDFAAYSLVFPGWEEADEGGLIAETTRMLGLPCTSLPPYHRPPGGYADPVESTADVPDYPTDSFFDELRHSALQADTRVLLTGVGGDEWLSGTDFQTASMIGGGEVRNAIRFARARAPGRKMNVPKYLWHFGLRPLVPKRIVAAARLVRPPALSETPWILSSFTCRTRLAERISESFIDVASRRSPSNHYYIAAYERGLLANSLEAHERLNARLGVESRHPFHDRRLVDFCNGIPEGEKRNPQFSKLVLRNALKGRAPEVILNRGVKAHFTRMIPIELENAVPSGFWDQLVIADRGWVDKQEIRVVWENFLARARQGHYVQGRIPWSLWRAFGFELLARRGFL